MTRTYIISDIHGCSAPLQRLLDRLPADPSRDRLILLGDLFDRGPDSWGVLQIVKSLAETFGGRFVMLRGNHEDYLLQKRLSFGFRRVWERVGKGTTVQSFLEHGEKMEDSAQWIREHSVLYYTEEYSAEDTADPVVHFYCVHAGMMVDPPSANDTYTLVHDHRIVFENRYSGPLAITGHIALETPAYFAGDGETVEELPEEKWMELPKTGTICIDAGCGKGGRLIGMMIEGQRFILYGEPEDPEIGLTEESDS